jgi:hypothetical protein
MSVKLQYQSEVEYANTKFLILKATVVGNYGTITIGDLLNLAPSQNGGADGGITDPNNAYNHVLELPPSEYGILNEAFGGSYLALVPNAVPTLTNLGMVMYEPGGIEKATGAAYTAAELAGFAFLLVAIPNAQ